MHDKIEGITKDNGSGFHVFSVLAVESDDKTGFNTRVGITGSKGIMIELLVKLCEDNDQFSEVFKEVSNRIKSSSSSDKGDILKKLLSNMPSNVDMRSLDMSGKSESEMKEAIEGMLGDIKDEIEKGSPRKRLDLDNFSDDIDSDD